MSDIIKCERCGKTIISEELHGHDCYSLLVGTQEIGISEFSEIERRRNGDNMFVAKGINKISYVLIWCKHNPPHANIQHTIKAWRNSGDLVQNEQEIGIEYFYEDDKDLHGDQIYIAKGLNGIMYRFARCTHFPPHPDTKPTILTERRTDEDFTVCNISINITK